MNVGDRASRSRLVEADDIVRFTAMTGDRNPLHYDADVAAASRFGGIIVQGGVTTGLLNALVAEDLPGPGSVFLNVNWDFRAPTRPGDVITAHAEIISVHPIQADLHDAHDHHQPARRHGRRGDRRRVPRTADRVPAERMTRAVAMYVGSRSRKSPYDRCDRVRRRRVWVPCSTCIPPTPWTFTIRSSATTSRLRPRTVSSGTPHRFGDPVGRERPVRSRPDLGSHQDFERSTSVIDVSVVGTVTAGSSTALHRSLAATGHSGYFAMGSVGGGAVEVLGAVGSVDGDDSVFVEGRVASVPRARGGDGSNTAGADCRDLYFRTGARR